MRLSLLASCIGLLVAELACGANSQKPSAPARLHIGDPAPALDVMKWLKDPPVTKFKKGQVYVVEFWATWCESCEVLVPHLSALAKRYQGQVTVIGIDSMERGQLHDTSPDAAKSIAADIKRVTHFVGQQGERMAYTVAMDNPVDNPVMQAWAVASGRGGTLPVALVVDDEGKIAWAGSGIDLDERLIRSVLNHTLNRGAAAADRNQARIRVGPNILVSLTGDGTENNLSLAANPTNPRNLVGMGAHFRTGVEVGEPFVQVNRGYYSLNGGSSWNIIHLPEEDFGGGFGPQAAFGRTGTAYLLSQSAGSSTSGMLQFYRSEDGGLTWGKGINIWAKCHESCGNGEMIVDQTNGRFAGNIYISALYVPEDEKDQNNDYHIGVFRSADDGRSWIGPVDAANNHKMPGRALQVTNPALFSDGELFVSLLEVPLPLSGKTEQPRYWFATSSDGGATFSPVRRLLLKDGNEILEAPNYDPFFTIDTSHSAFRDRLYVAWLDICYFPGAPGSYDLPFGEKPQPARVWLSYSADRGKSWSKPKIISARSPGVGNEYGPVSIAVNNEGTVGVSWYDTRDSVAASEGDLVNRYFAASIDGGESFLAAVKMSSAPTSAAVRAAHVVGAVALHRNIHFSGARSDYGEYLGQTAAPDGLFHAFWSDGRTGSDQIWTARIRVERTAHVTRSVNFGLVEADVRDSVDAVPDPLRLFPSPGTLELPIRLKNISQKTLYGPLQAEVLRVTPEGTILNAANGAHGEGAIFDYSRALGDFESLAPGETSEAVVWRFKAPANGKEVPRFEFKVTAQVDKSAPAAADQ